jgi:hypothetical protein
MAHYRRPCIGLVKRDAMYKVTEELQEEWHQLAEIYTIHVVQRVLCETPTEFERLIAATTRDGYAFVTTVERRFVHIDGLDRVSNYRLLAFVYKTRLERISTTALVLQRLGVCKDIIGKVVAVMN